MFVVVAAPEAAPSATPADGNAPALADPLARGRYLVDAGLCAFCHTADGGAPFAGGRPVQTTYGILYSRNITPDRAHGIGDWSAEDFVRAIKEGIAPDGTHYYPAFPYRSFSLMSRDDMLALWAYLRTVEPVAQPNRPHELAWYASRRWSLGLWKWLNFDPEHTDDAPMPGGLWTDGIYQDDSGGQDRPRGSAAPSGATP
jgi:mono/diheme cytochrome c family protein